jgi:hypothetical protein
MGKAIGLLLIVICIWAGIEVYSYGVQGAFGGVFASFAGPGEPPRDTRSVPQRAGSAVQGAHSAADDRRDRLLSD